MPAILVRSTDTRDKRRVVFDQEGAGVVLNAPARVVIRADGQAHAVNGSLKVVKDAIARGDLVQVFTSAEEAQAALEANDRQLPERK